ncbi:MAG: hypothetical protein QOK15_438 [Nocardioidaceae bacterium]|nr:hypothetical protein [Nocardioidaceae bacterium]
MPMEKLDIGQGPEEPRLAGWWHALPPAVRRTLLVLAAVGISIAAGVAWARTDFHQAAQPAAMPNVGRTADALGPPPWAMRPRQIREPSFALVNRSDRRVFVSTPPRFVFTVPPHRRLLFARAPVCTYQRFTARFGHGPPIGTIRNFCSENSWTILRSGEARLR